jgi:hypothetical protein
MESGDRRPDCSVLADDFGRMFDGGFPVAGLDEKAPRRANDGG